MSKRVASRIAAIFIVASVLSTSNVIASNTVNFQTIQPAWISPALSSDYSHEYKLFTDASQRVLISQFAGSNHLAKSMLTIVSNGNLTPIEALKYPRNYNGSILGQIGPELFIVDEFFNGAPADDPDRTKMSNWQYPSHQKYFIKNLAGENVSAGLDKNRIQRIVNLTDSRFLTTTVLKGDLPPVKGEKTQFVHKFQLLNSTNFAEPLQIWESQVFESERDPNWNPYIFANDSVLLGIEEPVTPANTRCGKLIGLNSSGQLDLSWSNTINKLLQINPKTKDLSLVDFNTKPIKLDNNRLVFKMKLNSTQSLCRKTDTQAFLFTDIKGEIVDLKISNYPIFDNWRVRESIWIECVTSDRCLNIDGGGKVYWTDQNLQEVSNSTYYQLLPLDNLPISGTSFRYGSSPITLSPVTSTVKNWNATQVLINNNQIVGLLDAQPNMQNDPNFATQWNSNFLAGFSIPEAPKVIRSTATSITCIKGKLTKKISGTNPKCPKGYKVKV